MVPDTLLGLLGVNAGIDELLPEDGKFVMPLGDDPAHEYVVPLTVELKLMTEVATPLQTVWFAMGVMAGIGLTITVDVALATGQGPIGSLVVRVMVAEPPEPLG